MRLLVCISVLIDHSAPATMTYGDYRGQNASAIQHNQSALGDKPAYAKSALYTGYAQ